MDQIEKTKGEKKKTKKQGATAALSFKPVCSCIRICPREIESAVKDPDFEDSLYSATCKKTEDGPSNITARVEADAILAYVPRRETESARNTKEGKEGKS